MNAANSVLPASTIDRVFGVLAEPATYKRLLFLFLGFPLAVFYFSSMVPLISVGIGLIPIVVGLAILAGALFIVKLYAGIERLLTAGLLGAIFVPRARREQGLRTLLLDPAAWKSVLYFAFRLPLSVVGFAVAVVMVTGLSLLFTPVLYTILPMQVLGEQVTQWQVAILVACVGATLGLLSAHAVNAIADLERRLAEWLL